MQNVRTIAKRDVQKFFCTSFLICSERLYSIQSFGKSLLCVCDYLSMAVTSVPKEKIEGENVDQVSVSRSLQVDSSFLVPGSRFDTKGVR